MASIANLFAAIKGNENSKLMTKDPELKKRNARLYIRSPGDRQLVSPCVTSWAAGRLGPAWPTGLGPAWPAGGLSALPAKL